MNNRPRCFVETTSQQRRYQKQISMSIYRHYFRKIFKRPCEGNICIYFCFELLQLDVFKVLRLNVLCKNKKPIPSSSSKNNYLFIL